MGHPIGVVEGTPRQARGETDVKGILRLLAQDDNFTKPIWKKYFNQGESWEKYWFRL